VVLVGRRPAPLDEVAAAIAAAGGTAYDIWPEAAHAFTNMATPLGELALGRTTTWISTILDSVP